MPNSYIAGISAGLTEVAICRLGGLFVEGELNESLCAGLYLTDMSVTFIVEERRR